MKCVLITRPEPGASQTAVRLSALGLEPVVAPVLSIVSRDLSVPARVAATLLTSRNAVVACPAILHDRPVFAVGTATAARAMEAGFINVFDAGGNAAALTNLVVSMMSPTDGSLFLPTGRGQGAALAASLRRHGFHTVRRVAYEVARVPILPGIAVTHLRQGRLDAAMFFSGETSRHFVHLLRAADLAESVCNVAAVSISEQAAVALRSLPWWRISVASKPNQDAMLVLLND